MSLNDTFITHLKERHFFSNEPADLSVAECI